MRSPFSLSVADELRRCRTLDNDEIYYWLWRVERSIQAFRTVVGAIRNMQGGDGSDLATDWARRNGVMADALSYAIEAADALNL